MADRVYSKEEADAILARAIELQGHAEATSHTDLLATAREIGVAPEAIEKAAAEVLERRHDDAALRALRAGQWRGFLAHLVPFVLVGLLLGFINVATGGFPWAVIPMLAWFVGLGSHLLAVALPNEDELRRRIESERERERERKHDRVRRPGKQVSGDSVQQAGRDEAQHGGARVRVGADEEHALDEETDSAEERGQRQLS
jgi:hypothetical protein